MTAKHDLLTHSEKNGVENVPLCRHLLKHRPYNHCRIVIWLQTITTRQQKQLSIKHQSGFGYVFVFVFFTSQLNKVNLFDRCSYEIKCATGRPASYRLASLH